METYAFWAFFVIALFVGLTFGFVFVNSGITGSTMVGLRGEGGYIICPIVQEGGYIICPIVQEGGYIICPIVTPTDEISER